MGMSDKKLDVDNNISESDERYAVIHFKDYISPRTGDYLYGRRPYVLWGENNEFFEHLRDIYLNSTTNNATINGIIRLTYGKGLEFKSREQQRKLFSFISAKDLRRLMLQFYIYNKFVVQVEYDITKKGREVKREIKKAFYLPAKNIGIGKKNDDGEAECYYYCEDWSNVYKDKPKRVPAFGLGEDSDEIEIYYFQEEFTDDEYFAPVRYHGAIQYAESEVEQSNFHINHLLNGFAPPAIINFNNGVPPKQKRREIIRDFRKTKTGSENAGKPFIAFNDSADRAVTVEGYNIPDPHKQYEFINDLCEKKIFIAHGVTSPLLLGVRDTSGGLGSNANEIQESYKLFKEMTLEPFRESFIDALLPLLLSNGISEVPKFKDLDIFSIKSDISESNNNIDVSSQKNYEDTKFGKENDLSEEIERAIISGLENAGELIDGDEWLEVATSREVGLDISAEKELTNILFANDNTSPPDGVPQGDSELGDSGLYKIRYRYTPAKVQDNSRDLCRFLVGRAKAGVVYRIEEIEEWEKMGINSQFAAKGESTYSLWKYKGGVNCHHYWSRVVFFRKRNADGTFKSRSKTAEMESDERTGVKAARRHGVPEEILVPKDWDIVKTRPIDMPGRGRKL